MAKRSKPSRRKPRVITKKKDYLGKLKNYERIIVHGAPVELMYEPPAPKRSFVAAELEAKAVLFDEKDKAYGKNYLIAGDVLSKIFGGYINITTPEEFNRFALYNQMLNKMMRYAQNFHNGGHEDSLDDLSIYAMMTKEADRLFAPDHEPKRKTK